MYTAFMVDIVNSKKIKKEDREQIQIFIKQCSGVLNTIFKPSLEFDVIFSAGDELQGLFKGPTSAYLYFRLFSMLLMPLQIRCGMGVGEWDVRIHGGTSSEQDGSVYHHARTAILIAHEKNEYNVLFNSDNENDFYINTLLNTSFIFVKKQSRYQRQIQLLVELMLPLFDENAMDLQSFSLLLNLVQSFEYQEFLRITQKQSQTKLDLFTKIAADFDPINIFSTAITDSKLVIASTLKKGISTKISNITNTSRQNIEKLINTANISKVRSTDLTILLFMNNAFRR